MISLCPSTVDEVAVLGAHCDDVAIGAGGTLLMLARDNPDLRVRALVLTGGGTIREDEERAALAAFCPVADLEITVLDLPDGRLPEQWGAVKSALARFRRSCLPDLVLGPQRHDAHQDHRLLATLLPTEFRDQLTLGYEILKWETDTPSPTLFHPLSAEIMAEKSRLLHECYRSQVDHDWFDAESFGGLARLRGVHCRRSHAEAFVMEKATIEFGTRS